MAYDPYSRTNQQTLDGVIVGAAFYGACLIGYAGNIPFERSRFWVVLFALVAGRLISNFLFGLHKIQWRYIGLRDVFRTGRSYVAFSGLLLLVQFLLPATTGIVRIPGNIIAVELLLSLLGAVGIRVLRRHLYE